MTSIPAAISKFTARISNVIIPERKDFFLNFYCISGICMKVRAFWRKKDQYPGLIISEIIDAKRRG